MANKEKNIITKHLQKTDTSAHWKIAEDAGVYKPLKGQIIYYQDEGKPIRYKVGDGKTLLRDLPFANEVYTTTVTNSIVYDGIVWETVLNRGDTFQYEIEVNSVGNYLGIEGEEPFEEIHYELTNPDEGDESIYGEGTYYTIHSDPTGEYFYLSITLPVNYVTEEYYGKKLYLADSFRIETFKAPELTTPVRSIESGEGILLENNDGTLFISESVKSIEGSKSGTEITIDDISPLDREIEIQTDIEVNPILGYIGYGDVNIEENPSFIAENCYLKVTEINDTEYVIYLENGLSISQYDGIEIGDTIYLNFDESYKWEPDALEYLNVAISKVVEYYNGQFGEVIVNDGYYVGDGFPHIEVISEIDESYILFESGREFDAESTIEGVTIGQTVYVDGPFDVQYDGTGTSYSYIKEVIPVNNSVTITLSNEDNTETKSITTDENGYVKDEGYYPVTNISSSNKNVTVSYSKNVNAVLNIEQSDRDNALVRFKELASKANIVNDKVPYEELPTMDLHLTSTDEETVDKIPSAESVRDCLSKKIEGYSSKYEVVEKGWHRVLNTIRGNPGQLYLTLTDGFSLQSLEIDLAGFVRLGSSIETPEDVGYLFCKSNSSYMYPRHSSVQADPYFKYKITAMRMGYASQAALKEKFDTSVSAGVSINSYIDVYIDYNVTEDTDKNAQLLVQFTGKGDQHNSYRIDEETTDTNYVTSAGNNIGQQVTLDYGLYGEELEFINVPIREDYDSVDGGYKSKLVDDFNVKVSDDSGVYTSLNEAHNITDISKIGTETPETTLRSVRFRLYRKYNLLPLFSCHSNNDFFSTYNWKNGATNGKYKGGNLINPFRSGKKVIGGVHYGVTAAGTIIFDGGDTPSSIQNINVYYSNQESTAIKLPAGTYMTNVNDLYYTDNLSATTQNKVLLSNYVGGIITNKCFRIDSPKYLTFARICVTPNHWPFDPSELGVYTPFLIKVPDDIQLGSATNGAHTITDERWKNFSIKSSLEGEYPEFSVNEDGWLELADKYSDYITIEDTYNDETHYINKFDDFYSSWRAHGLCDLSYYSSDRFYGIKEIDFNNNQIKLANGTILGDNELLRKYNMYVDRSENPYDTLFMFSAEGFDEYHDIFEIHHNDIRSAKSLFKKLDYIETILKENGLI